MSKLVLACPNCKQKLTAPEGAERFRCPHCKTVLAAPRSTAPAAPEREDPAIGQELAGYTITRLIGRGGMGTVFEAVQQGLKRRVALKVLPDAVARDSAFFASFKREAQATAKLNHPNIIQIFDIDEDKGYHFFSMEFVDGESLADRLVRQKRVALADALDIVAQVATALEHACEHMLIHRDIKPSNILLTAKGDVKLADLGLSKSLEETAVGIARGTHGGPVYMAPEYSRNPQLADCRSDIYALGAVLFHLLTGRPPFPGPSMAELIGQHAKAPLPSARAVAPAIPEGVDELIQKMCAKDPAQRFQTHRELLDQLRLLLKSTAVRMPKVLDAKPLAQKRRRRPWLPLAIAGAAVVALAVGAIILLPRLRGPRTKAAVEAPTPKGTQPPAKAGPTPHVAEKKAGPTEEPKVEPPPKEPANPPDEEVAKPKAEEPKPPEPKAEEPDGPAWQAKLAAAKQAADVLANEKQFGKAAAAFDALVKDNDDADLKAAVDEAKKALAERAAKEFEAVAKAAAGLVAEQKFDEARAALQGVADTFGTAEEVKQAQEAIGSLDGYRKGLDALKAALGEADAAVAAAARRAEQQAALAKALEPVGELLKGWKLAEASAAFGKLKFDDERLAAQVDQRKAAADALAAFCGAVGEALRAASPRLKKSELRIVGLNGDLLDANAAGIKAEVAMGANKKAEIHAWGDLRDVSVEAVAKRFAKPGNAADQLAVYLWLRLLGNDEKAQTQLNRADELGAKTDALGDPAKAVERAEREAAAARALADAIKLCLGGKASQGVQALASFKDKFSDTDYCTEHQKLVDAAMAFKPFSGPTVAEAEPPPEKPTETPKPTEPEVPEPKKPPAVAPGDEKKARELYDGAAAALAVRRFEDCKKLLDELQAKLPGAAVMTDKALKPTVEAMVAGVAARGPHLKVGRGARGVHPTLEKALLALDTPQATIELEATIHRGMGNIAGPQAEGLVLRTHGDRHARLDGGTKRDTVLKLANNVKDVWLDSLEFANTKTAVEIGTQATATFYNCIALQEVGSALSRLPAGAKITVVASAFEAEGIGDIVGRYSAFVCADQSAVEGCELTGCIIVGNNLEIRKASLTDCLLIGSALLDSDSRLNHVTAVGPLQIPEDGRNVRIDDCILQSIEMMPSKHPVKGKKAASIVATVSNTLLYGQAKDLPKDLVKTDEVKRGRAPFVSAGTRDYRLPKDSPLRDKASDSTELGCRFPPEMLELLKLARRFPQLLKPPPSSGTRRP